ncbi:MAG: hypothetical protein A2W91_07915 [Bacteroidetes bacterium GWF2_38_335]|nr:MAG: hypothetical protein A2W91_07915 [Bacteroidetes bacterium GWF2_38_335]OFY79022.1 MAG: hypothetical protein A2281_02805 [Bacteroidetes bacterium RIFOXYA12_FULL_38_20]HBS86102.1 hypothetical protein [Bacteroidales bacterium]
MNCTQKHILVFLLLFYGLISFSQNVEFDKSNFKDDKEGLKAAQDQIVEGDDLYEQGVGVYMKALEYYLNANNFNPNNALLNYKIGNCYIYSIQKDLAITYFLKAYELDPKINRDVLFKIGLAYQHSYEFNQAMKNYRSFEKSLTPDENDKWDKILQKKMSECETGAELLKNPAKVDITNLGSQINTQYPEHSPVISADESVMYFTSRRVTTTGGQIDPLDFHYYEDIYISKNINGKWTEAIPAEKPINTEEHDATVGISPDGQRLFIYKGKRQRGDIYLCKQKGESWTPPKKLPDNINSQFHESSACFNHDDSRIYFVSDRLENNFGGRDIYYVEKNEDGSWSEATNMGKPINTIYDEDCVFMHPDGKTMYFSSNGPGNMGGYDIFYSVMSDEGDWNTPVNIGYPINTPDDDVFFTISASGKHGYYASFRKDGLGEKDIFRVEFLADKKQETKDEVIHLVTIVKGKITEADNTTPISADIEIWDIEKNVRIATFTSNSATGNYLLSLPSGKNYGINVAAEGYLFHSENFNIQENSGFAEIIKNITLNKLTQGSSIILNNIFFDYAKATLKSESFTELDKIVKIMNAFPSMKIEIGGHTDNVSSAETNAKLSEERAKSVVDYLILEGINNNRLSYKGYSFSKPIAPNDTEVGRAKNRRVEFTIIEK